MQRHVSNVRGSPQPQSMDDRSYRSFGSAASFEGNGSGGGIGASTSRGYHGGGGIGGSFYNAGGGRGDDPSAAYSPRSGAPSVSGSAGRGQPHNTINASSSNGGGGGRRAPPAATAATSGPSPPTSSQRHPQQQGGGGGDGGMSQEQLAAAARILKGTALDLGAHRRGGALTLDAVGGGRGFLRRGEKAPLRIGGTSEDKAFDTILRGKVQQIFAFSMTGIAAVVAVALATWYLHPHAAGFPTDAYYDDPAVAPTTLNIMYLSQAVLTTTTVVSCVLIWQKYQLLLMLKRAEWGGVTVRELERYRGDAALDTNRRAFLQQSYNFMRSTLKYVWALETLIHLLHPVIWMASVRSVRDGTSLNSSPNTGFKLMQIAVFFRLYLLGDIVHLHNPSYKERFTIITAKPELLKVGFTISKALSLKLFFYSQPVLFLCATGAASLGIFGFLAFILERPEGTAAAEVSFLPFDPANSLWSAFETFVTVGYGDIVPATTIGRIILAVCTIAGTVTFVVFSAVLVQQMALSKEQKCTLEFLASREADEAYRLAAEGLIWTWIERFIIPEVMHAAGRGIHAVVGPGGGGIGGGLDDDDDTAARSRAQRHHKGNQVYFVTKKFRSARRALEASFAQADDEVIDQKLAAVQTLADALAMEVAEHEEGLSAVQEELRLRMQRLTEKITRLRAAGHVPV